MTPELVALIEEKFELDWSPEQIAGRLKLEECFISHESIYRYIRKHKKNDGSLYKRLRKKGKKYNKHVSGKAGRGCIPYRPAVVEQKACAIPFLLEAGQASPRPLAQIFFD